MAEPGRVLVTRPQGQAVALCEALERAGFVVFSQPLLVLEPPPELSPQQRSLLLDLDRFEHVIFISGNAVSYGMSLLGDYWPQLPVGLNWYAIGEATARLLEDYGVRAITPGGDMTSESLLALPALQHVEGQRVLLVKGEGGRQALHRELARRGGRVEELACYRRRCPQLEPGELGTRLSRWRPDYIMISSGEGLANLLRLLSPEETTKLGRVSLLVPSGRIARQAEAAGFTQVSTAENATDAAMLRALEGLFRGSGE